MSARVRRVALVPGVIWSNLGDLGILHATIGSIRARLGPEASIRVLSIFPPRGPRDLDLGPNVEIVPYPIALPIRGIGALSRVGMIALTLPVLARLHRRAPRLARALAPWAAPTLDAIAGSDLVIATGGNYLIDHGRGIPAFLLPVHLINVAAALRRPIAFWGHSVGPFRRRWLSGIATRTMRRATTITLREPLSLDDVPQEARARVHVTADAAFLLEAEPLSPELRALVERPTLAVTTLPWRFAGADDPAGARERYYDAMAQALDAVVETRGLDVLFIPHQAGWERENDHEAIDAIRRRARQSERMRVAPVSLSPGEAIALLRECVALVGTRMHSVIFAIVAGTPSIGIGYVRKTRGTLGMLGLDQYAFEAETLAADDLRAAIERLLDDAGARARVAKARDEARERASQNVDLALGRA